jgi:hypothetical protein
MGNTQKLGTLINGLSVDASGNVVIGKSTITAGGNFEVYNATQGNLYISSSGTNDSCLRFFSGGNELVTMRSTGTGALRIETGTGSPAERLRITSTGLVGIGTSGPNFTLDVNTSSSNSVFAATTSFTHTTGYLDHSTFLAPNMTGGALSVSFGKSATNYNTGKFVFNYAGNNSTSNSVGIGFYNADNILVVRADGNVNINSGSINLHNGYFRLRNSAGTATYGLIIQKATWTGSGTDYSPSFCAETNYGLSFYTNGTADERLRIDTDGTVKLGTYHSTAKFLPGADSNHYLRYNSSLDGLEMSGYSGVMFSTLGGTERVRINTSGNLFIGKSSTNMSTNGCELNGNGTAVFSFTISNNEAIIFNNIATSTTYEIDFRTNAIERGKISVTDSGVSYLSNSDYRLKEDLKDFNGLAKLSNIKVYDFKFKDLNERRDGVIAHELQEVIPYAVSGEKDGKKFQSVDYSRIVPVLIKSIQELKAEIEILKNK